MRNTASNKRLTPGGTALLYVAALWCAGCLSVAPPPSDLAAAQSAARARLLELRVAAGLRDAAGESVNRRQSVRLAGLASDYPARAEEYDAASDPALNELENAIAYAEIVRAERPEERARELISRRLDFEIAVRWCQLAAAGKARRNDLELELELATAWPRDRIRAFDFASLPAPEFKLLPIRPDAERRIAVEGHAAAFRLAAEVYRRPTGGNLAAATELRDALLNSHLMRGAARGDTPRGRLELQLAALRVKARYASVAAALR